MLTSEIDQHTPGLLDAASDLLEVARTAERYLAAKLAFYEHDGDEIQLRAIRAKLAAARAAIAKAEGR